MRNRISCSAQELGQLDPDMVQSVVGGQVFKIGDQYFSDQRVSILEANGTQVVAEVNGTYGVYSQTIKLRGGTLSTKCSCPSTEQPFCRHCVAVLLQQFHTGSTENETSKAAPPPSSEPESSPEASSSSGEPAATVDLNFREATLFIDWIQQAIAPLGKEPSLPAVPESLKGVAREWAGVIDRLNQKFLESEEDRTDAQQNLQSAETMVDSLTKDLKTVKGESEAAQLTNSKLDKRVKELEESLSNFSQVSKDLETVKGESEAAQLTNSKLDKRVKELEESLSNFSQVSKERDRLVGNVSTMQSELQNKGAELESVSMTLKSLSNAIRNLLPSGPP